MELVGRHTVELVGRHTVELVRLVLHIGFSVFRRGTLYIKDKDDVHTVGQVG